ncbi:unnamed protein product [Adineta steineri]|uniref:Cytochrome b561 domain-containing protein n=1 Tax=Adineta steineri TaxID=433720 RepID=A0A814J4T0_9BILA|nr:unnamed protein product [Adineta steineri]CAF3885127.1 unnamed protein product [Adineta steineri]
MPSNMDHAHGTVMILSWMVFGSTGVLFARYGRVLQLGNQRQLLGKSIWFQIHRLLLSLSSLLTLVGFYFILVHLRGQWSNLNTSSKALLAHAICGSIIICCIIIQIWLALYRCHPHSHFRFIFNFSHRIFGSVAFCLSLCNFFLISFYLSVQHIDLVIIVSLWTTWVIIVVILFEIIQYHYRKASALMALNARVSHMNAEPINHNARPDTEAGTHAAIGNQRLNRIKLFLFLIHALISVAFCIPFIVIIWHQT